MSFITGLKDQNSLLPLNDNVQHTSWQRK